MKRIFPAALVAASLALGGTLSAQLNFPEIPFDAVELLTLPPNIHMGEAAGVATNSNGDIFVYTRTGTPVITTAGARNVSHGGSRLFKFDRTGKFVREMGQGVYGFLQAQQVRVDPQDNIWVVDQMSTQVVKFDPDGRIQMVLSRKPEAMRVPEIPMYPRPDTYGLVPAPMPSEEDLGDGVGMEGERFIRPTDVAWDSQGNIYVADGYGNSRVAKFDRNGKWIMNWGKRGSGPGEFNVLHGIAIDAANNVYVADRDNKRIQVFDANGTFKTQFRNVGSPWAICMTSGPNQFLYVSNSNSPYNLDYDGEILKMTLDGRIVGKFGRAGKMLKEFGTVNSIDCRTENELLVGELLNWRVQKLTLRPAATSTR
jgi:DNA-binding beta-propeller fold protein YncE